MNCSYCEDHGGAKAHTACPVCGKVSDTDDVDVCHICGHVLITPDGESTFCEHCEDWTINLALPT